MGDRSGSFGLEGVQREALFGLEAAEVAARRLSRNRADLTKLFRPKDGLDHALFSVGCHQAPKPWYPYGAREVSATHCQAPRQPVRGVAA